MSVDVQLIYANISKCLIVLLKGGIELTKGSKIMKFRESHDYYVDMAELFSIFSDPTRLKVLHALLDGEKCVKKICEIVGLNQSTCSHQLKILKQYKVVKAIRDGKYIRYSISDDKIKKIIEIGEKYSVGSEE